MREDRVTLQMADGVAELRLNRPDAGNGIDPAMVEAIDEALHEIEKSASVRAVLLTAAGPAFCVGGDLRFFQSRLDSLHEDLDSMIGVWHGSTLPRLQALPVPVVAAVQGGVGGGGLGLLWCSDIVIAADDLKLTTGFTRLGMTGDGGSTWHLPRLVGLRKAAQLTLRSTPVGAAEALEWGLVTSVVPAAALAGAGRAEAVALAAGPTWAYGRIKRLLDEGSRASYPEHLAAELAAMLDGADRHDVREGIDAFVARRRPVFDGR